MLQLFGTVPDEQYPGVEEAVTEEGVHSLAVCLTRRRFVAGKMADGQRKGKRKNYVL